MQDRCQEEIRDYAYKLLEKIEKIRLDLMIYITGTADSTKITRINYPDLEEVSNVLIHLVHNSEHFANMVLTSINANKSCKSLSKDKDGTTN